MDLFCGECAHIDTKNKRSYSDEYYCNLKRKYVSLTDKGAKRCNSYLFNPGCRGNKSTFRPSGLFYIITALNNILGRDFNVNIMMTLEEQGMKLKNSDDELIVMLFEDYDIAGALIADKLYKRKNKKEFAMEIYMDYILPVCSDIKNNKGKEALKKYLIMVDDLKSYFNIEGMMNLKYVVDSVLTYDDLFCRTVGDCIGVSKNHVLSNIAKHMKETQDQEMIELYDELSVLITDKAYNIDNEAERKIYVSNYFNNYIRPLYKAFKNNNGKEEINMMLTDIKCDLNKEKNSYEKTSLNCDCNDMLCCTYGKILEIESNPMLSRICNFFKNTTDEKAKQLYSDISSLLTEIASSISDDDMKQDFVMKYFNTYLKVLYQEIILSPVDMEEVRRLLTNITFTLLAEQFIPAQNNNEEYTRKLSNR